MRRPAPAPGAPALLAAALLALALLPSPAAGTGEGEHLPNDPLAGRKAFIQKGCGECHSIWGAGGTIGPDLGRRGMGRTLLQLSGTLWNHSPQMVEKMRERHLPRPLISSAEMRDLASFLYSLNYFDEPGDPALGKTIFEEKGCARCHAVEARGPGVGPSLTKYRGFMSPVTLARAMWGHAGAMAGRMKEEGIPWPQFHGHEVAHLMAFIRSGGETPSERIYLLPGNPAEGQRLFEEKGCAGCHTLGEREWGIGPDLETRDLGSSVTEISGVLWNHAPAMLERIREAGIPPPAFGDKEMSDLLAYLYFLRFLDKPGNPATGRRIFQARGCASCHAVAGKGEPIGPDLAHSRSAGSLLEWASSMWNHAPAMAARLEEWDLPWPRFEGDEMRDLWTYLRSVSRPGEQGNGGR